ncbi:MAG: methyltransferase type 11 [Candidatus Sedimenticola endophacoides]|uniref:Methyltransferase type 11 n=1 Tax=Candidatus Sedimenticola endophacoides TaxID=2548426 RepID=A0A657PN35_9GAMM|nr:MAG: methyltransferase type 11 [Candidatus Sedimenticola endophacoides]
MQQEAHHELFDDWPDQYDRWFRTPIGTLVKRYEGELLLDLVQPSQGETILDVGCGSGIFTLDLLSHGPSIVGLDISQPMLSRAREKTAGLAFEPVAGDMLSLPFADNVFDKTVSMTALEFVADAHTAINELFRVTQKGGTIVVTTLNSLSPWATRRKQKAEKGHPLFSKMYFRSPEEMRILAPVDGLVKTAIHFQKDDPPKRAIEIEREGQAKALSTGAFLAVSWVKI